MDDFTPDQENGSSPVEADPQCHGIARPPTAPDLFKEGLFDDFDPNDAGKDFTFGEATHIDPNKLLKSNPGKVHYDQVKKPSNMPFITLEHAAESSQDDQDIVDEPPATTTNLPPWKTPGHPQRPSPPDTVLSAAKLPSDMEQDGTTIEARHRDAQIKWPVGRPSVPNRRGDVGGGRTATSGEGATRPSSRGNRHVESDDLVTMGAMNLRQRLSRREPLNQDQSQEQMITPDVNEQSSPSRKSFQAQQREQPMMTAMYESTSDQQQSSPTSGASSSSRKKRPDRPFSNRPASSGLTPGRPLRTTPRTSIMRPRSRVSATSNISKRRAPASRCGDNFSPSTRSHAARLNKSQPSLVRKVTEHLAWRGVCRKDNAAALAEILNNDYRARDEDDEIVRSHMDELESEKSELHHECARLQEKVTKMETKQSTQLNEIDLLNKKMLEKDDFMKQLQEKARKYKAFLNKATEENQVLYRKTKEHHQQTLADMRAEIVAHQTAVAEAAKKGEADHARLMGTMKTIRDEGQKQAHESQLKHQELTQQLRFAESRLEAEKERAESLKDQLQDRSELVKKLELLEQSFEEKMLEMTNSHTNLAEKVESRSAGDHELISNLAERLDNIDQAVSAQTETLATVQGTFETKLEGVLEKNESIVEQQAVLQKSTDTLAQELQAHMGRLEGDLRRQADDLNHALAQCEEENMHLRTELDKTKQAYDQAADDLDRSEAHVEDQDSRIQLLIEQVETLEAAAQDDGHLDAQLRELQQKHDRLKDELGSKAAAVSKLHDQLKTQVQVSVKDLKQQKESLEKADKIHCEKLRSDMDKAARDANLQLERLQNERDTAHKELNSCKEEMHRLQSADKTAVELEAKLAALKEENSKHSLSLIALAGIDKSLKRIQSRYGDTQELKAAFSELPGNNATDTESCTRETFVRALPRFVDMLALKAAISERFNKQLPVPSNATNAGNEYIPAGNGISLEDQTSARPVNSEKLSLGSDGTSIRRSLLPSKATGKGRLSVKNDNRLDESPDQLLSKRVKFVKTPDPDDEDLYRGPPPTVDEERSQRRQGLHTKSIIKPAIMPSAARQAKKHAPGNKSNAALSKAAQPVIVAAETDAISNQTDSQRLGARRANELVVAPMSNGSDLQSGLKNGKRLQSDGKDAPRTPTKRAKTEDTRDTKPTYKGFLDLLSDNSDGSHDSSADMNHTIDEIMALQPKDLDSWSTPPKTLTGLHTAARKTLASSTKDVEPKGYTLREASEAKPAVRKETKKTNHGESQGVVVGKRVPVKEVQEEFQESLASSHFASQDGGLRRATSRRRQTMPNYR